MINHCKKLFNTSKGFSLSKNFFTIIGFIFLALIIVVILSSWFSYKQFTSDENRKIIIASDRIQQSLEESFGYSEHLMDHFAKQIKTSSSKNNKTITKLLRSDLASDPIVQKFFSWTLFDWIDKNDHLTSIDYMHDNTKILDLSDRDYIQSIKTNPWHLNFSTPAIGKPSGQWVIPAAFGVTDQNNEYLGAIGMGFNIIMLKNKIDKEIESLGNLDYILINNKLDIILSSSEFNPGQSIVNLKNIDHSFVISKADSGLLDNTLNFGDASYLYFKNLPDQPFIILVGYNHDLRVEELQDLISTRASGIFVVGFITMIMLLGIRKFIVLPVVMLSEAAKKIITTSGQEEIIIQHSNVKELEILWMQVFSLRNLIHQIKSNELQLKESKIELEKAHNNIQKVNNELEDKILERTTSLEKALAVKTEFLNNISHEIRTPVQGFMGLSEGLDLNWHNYNDEQKHRYIHDIVSNAKRLSSLLGNLLDLAKFNEGKLLLNTEKCDLKTLIEDLIDEAQSLYMQNKNIKIIFENSANDSIIMADIERIGQVLRNLLINSIKFSPNNSQIQIKLTTDSSKNIIHFEISDQGPGIPENELLIIFDEFVQSSRTKTKAGGTGLGLSICNKIIKAHNGKIWAENNQSQIGAKFHFTLPMEIDQIEISEAPHISRIVVVIDDEASILEMMEMILTSNQHKIIKANGGVEGWRLIKKNAKIIDIIFLDLMMPDMHGIDVLKEIKKNPDTKNIPIIIQSGALDTQEKQICSDLGIVSFLKKPYTTKAVLETIAKNVSIRTST